MRTLRYATLGFLLFAAVMVGIYFLLAIRPVPDTIRYGVSFNTLYARELGLDWEETYRAILDELEVKHLRLAAHWPMIEPEKDQYNFAEMDLQVELAREAGADIVFALGRRLPRWPECHVPGWASKMSWEEQKAELRDYIRVVVERYRDEDHIIMWQVENEPFLTVFAYEHCGDLDKEFLDEEIALVRSLDPMRPVLITDSGNLGTWVGAYRRGDMFGTSVYVYLWNPEVGPFRTFLPPSWYRFKAGLMELLFQEKEPLLIELSAEPWLITPVADTELSIQLERMNLEKFEEIIEYARHTRFERQYLWGAEWWYWLKVRHGQPEFWERAERLYQGSK